MAALLLILALFQVAAQVKLRGGNEKIEVPAVTPPGFSEVVGKYRISSTAAPQQVFVEEPLTLKVRIAGAGPPEYMPRREHLHIFPDNLDAEFYLEAIPAEDQILPEKGLWEFVYRLRPKSTNVTVIPALRLVYYAPDSKRFQSSYSEEIIIDVKPRPVATPESLLLKTVQAPAGFYIVRPLGEAAQARSVIGVPSPWLLVVLLGTPPVICFGWYRIWRRLNPNAAQATCRRRSRAARLAIAALAKRDGNVSSVRTSLSAYLRQRFDLPAWQPTGSEVAAHLKRVGIAGELRDRWKQLFEICDRVEFAPAEIPDGELCQEAIRLIEAVESAPCVT